MVMGSGGTLFGFVLYRGAEGFRIYRSIMERELDNERDDGYALQQCVKLEFTGRTDLMDEDRTVIKTLGLPYKGRRSWPEFRSCVPGYLPWFLDASEARLLTLGLTAVCRHIERVNGGGAVEHLREGGCPVYTPLPGKPGEFRAEWEPWPAEIHPVVKPPILNLARLSALRAKKPEPGSAWEVGVYYLPIPIFDRERPYFTRVAVACQESTGFAWSVEAAAPETSAPQMLADVICSSIEKSGFSPGTIFVMNALEAAALAPLAKALGIAIRRRENLTTVQIVKEEMMTHLVRDMRKRRKGR